MESASRLLQEPLSGLDGLHGLRSLLLDSRDECREEFHSSDPLVARAVEQNLGLLYVVERRRSLVIVVKVPGPAEREPPLTERPDGLGEPQLDVLGPSLDVILAPLWVLDPRARVQRVRIKPHLKTDIQPAKHLLAAGDEI